MVTKRDGFRVDEVERAGGGGEGGGGKECEQREEEKRKHFEWGRVFGF